MRYSKSVMSLALAGILLIGYFFFVYTDNSIVSNTNTTNTVYENQFNDFNKLTSNSGTVVTLVAILLVISGIFYALKTMGRRRKYHH